MTLVGLLVAICVFGLVWYLVTTYFPMPAPIKTVITAVAVIALCIVLLQFFGYANMTLVRHR